MQIKKVSFSKIRSKASKLIKPLLVKPRKVTLVLIAALVLEVVILVGLFIYKAQLDGPVVSTSDPAPTPTSTPSYPFFVSPTPVVPYYSNMPEIMGSIEAFRENAKNYSIYIATSKSDMVTPYRVHVYGGDYVVIDGNQVYAYMLGGNYHDVYYAETNIDNTFLKKILDKDISIEAPHPNYARTSGIYENDYIIKASDAKPIWDIIDPGVASDSYIYIRAGGNFESCTSLDSMVTLRNLYSKNEYANCTSQFWIFDSSWDFYGYGEENFQGISVASFDNGAGRKKMTEYLEGLDTTPTNACTGKESTISFGPIPQLRITCPTKYEINISSGYTRSDYNTVNFGDYYSYSIKPSAVIIENIRGEVVDINSAFNLWGEDGDGGGTITTLEENVKTNESVTIEGKKYYFSRYTHHIEYSETPTGQPCKSVKDICYTYITTLKVVNVPIGDSSYIIAIRQNENREYSGSTLIKTSKANDADIAEMMKVFETIKKY